MLLECTECDGTHDSSKNAAIGTGSTNQAGRSASVFHDSGFNGPETCMRQPLQRRLYRQHKQPFFPSETFHAYTQSPSTDYL